MSFAVARAKTVWASEPNATLVPAPISSIHRSASSSFGVDASVPIASTPSSAKTQAKTKASGGR